MWRNWHCYTISGDSPSQNAPTDSAKQAKMIMTRWFESVGDSHDDPVWKTGKGGEV